MSIRQRRVLITGGSRGIGSAIVQRFRDAGCEVFTPTRQELDLSSVDSIREYTARHNGIEVDILINNAGENKISHIASLSIEDWQRITTVNLTAPFLLIKHVTPHMVKNNWGRVVNISSCYSIVSRPGRVAYSASKAGLNSLTRTAALEYAGANILINAVCPGFVDTDMTRQNNTPTQIEELCRQVPLGRLAKPEEIASFVFFLGSEQNSYITGQTVIIDGGFMSR